MSSGSSQGIWSVLANLSKDYEFYVGGSTAYVNLLDNNALNLWLEVFDVRNIYRKYFLPNDLDITYVGSKSANSGDLKSFTSQLADSLKLQVKTGKTTTLEDVKSAAESRYYQIRQAHAGSATTAGGQLVNTYDLSGSGINITVTDASGEASISNISEACVDNYSFKGIQFIGLCGTLGKMVTSFKSPTFAKKDAAYVRLLMIINFALRGFLSKDYYNAVKYTGTSTNAVTLAQYLELMDNIRLNINKLKSYASGPPDFDFVLKIKRTVIYDVLNGERDMSNLKVKEKMCVKFRCSPLKFRRLDQHIITRIAKEANLDVDKLIKA